MILFAWHKAHGDGRLHCDRLPIQQCGLVAPLAHGFERRLHEERMPGDNLQFAHAPVLVDDRVQDDVALDSSLPRQRRIGRLESIDELRC